MRELLMQYQEELAGRAMVQQDSRGTTGAQRTKHLHNQPCLDSSSRTTELLLRREYKTLHQQKMEEEYKFKSAQSE